MTNPAVIAATSGPFAGNFEATGEIVYLDGNPFPKVVCQPSEEAKAWDGAKPETTHTIYQDLHGVHSYAEIVITGRGYRTHPKGIFGITAKVRFTGSDSDGEWFPAIVSKL